MEYIIIFISMCIQYGNKYFIGTFSRAVQKLLDYKQTVLAQVNSMQC